MYFNFALNLYMTLSSADNPFRQIGPRSKWCRCHIRPPLTTVANRKCGPENKIREFDTLERQTMGVNKYTNYASTFPMASCNKERCNHRKKKLGVKNIKIRNCFCKYAIEDNQVA